jgi:ring-1,2-phenylacetyl-CoA epoxidase subunit PaaD
VSASEPTGQTPQSVRCPFCGSADVELLALFGSQLLTDQYYCRACRTPFEHLRADAEEYEASGPVGLESREE